MRKIFIAILFCAGLYGQGTTPGAMTRQGTIPASCKTGSSNSILYNNAGTDEILTCDNTGHYSLPPGGSTSTLTASGVGASGAAGANKLTGPASSIITTDSSGNGSVLPTVTGDGTLDPATGALAVSKIGGQVPGNLYPQNAPASAPCLNTNIGSLVQSNTCVFPATPQQAASAGYNALTFYSTMPTGDFNLTGTCTSGHNWNAYNFLGHAPPPASTISFGQGFATLIGISSSLSQWATACQISSGQFTGVAFGGGFYAEALVAFNPSDVMANNDSLSWPSFWSMSVEHLANQGVTDQWPGQAAGYTHFFEGDFIEYDAWKFSPLQYFAATVHDWSGPLGSFKNVFNGGSGGTSFTNNVVNPGFQTEYRGYHKIAGLWIPATGSTPGSWTTYFDDVQTTSSVSWTQYNPLVNIPSGTNPGTDPATFGVVDNQHLVLLLATGLNMPMSVRSVSVWQTSAANNITHF